MSATSDPDPVLAAELLQGAWDMHLHAGPDVVPRVQRADEVLADAAAAGMAAIGLKDHCGSTAALAAVLDARSGPGGPRIFGSVTLNPPVGGVNPAAVEAALRAGARVIWFPTYAAQRHLERLGRAPFPQPVRPTGWTVRDSAGELRPGVVEVCALAAQHDAVVATGHLAPEEALDLLSVARGCGVRRRILTHASLGVTSAGLAVQRAAVEGGAWVEHCVLALTPGERACTEAEMAGQIVELGPENVVLTSDLGQPANGPVVAGYGAGLARLVAAGLPIAAARLVSSANPRRAHVG